MDFNFTDIIHLMGPIHNILPYMQVTVNTVGAYNLACESQIAVVGTCVNAFQNRVRSTSLSAET